MKKKLKAVIPSLLKLVIAVGLMTWLFNNGMLDVTFLFETITVKGGVICAFFVFLQLVLNNWRWKILLDSKGIILSFKEVFRLTLIGQFFNFAVPGGVGGDVIKGYYIIKKYPQHKINAGMTVLIDRVFGLVAMLLLALGVMFYQWNHIWKTGEMTVFFWGVLGLLVAILLFSGLGFSNWVYRYLESTILKKNVIENGGNKLKSKYWINRFCRLLMAFHLYGKNPRVISMGVLLSLLSQLCPVIFAFYLGGELMGENLAESLAEGSGAHFPLFVYLFAMPLALLATTLPLAPAGIGVGQAAIYFLIKHQTGVESDVGPNIMTLFQMMSLMWGLLGAVFYVKMKINVLLPDKQEKG